MQNIVKSHPQINRYKNWPLQNEMCGLHTRMLRVEGVERFVQGW
jgi:hypothetical protein